MMKEYQVVLIDENRRNGDSILDSSSWENANSLVDFSSPWSNESFSKIEFRALWDFDNLYFKFKVFDSEIYIDEKDNGFDSIGNSDRVELFFRKNNSLNPYYCLEMDTSARLMDFEALPGKVFDFDWKWPKEEISLKSSKDETSFTVEGRISVKSLNQLGLIQDNVIETGVFRAKFSIDENQNYEPTWISWVNPNTAEPNFHIASSFGKLILLR
ncbi:sugar-binding protein [Flavobacterium sp. LHD-80]|uniref:sugar-binding protein n=1 Tax=Flavobacterium sp. LHD-80 TaxID=3071411 RepID=UPI0027E1C96D|nr:sugar-binding protein [Flavobacterium sp. LHD-80]MDQ6469287.1 sugar-binding protein [Flavobacterium sp. LHD-80]